MRIADGGDGGSWCFFSGSEGVGRGWGTEARHLRGVRAGVGDGRVH
jgi:hypothetical protein